MFCYNCGCHLSEHDFCTSCGADVSLYKKIMCMSNRYYNDGLEKAGVRDLTGAINSLRQSLKFNKNNIEARNLLGLVYFETGEVVAALSEWVISKNMRPEKNIADDYINMLQSNAARLDAINETIKKYNQALVYCNQDSKDLAIIQLKKVLSLNPKFIRAHQLLALLYMDSEQWDRAERELSKCMDIDRNNTLTLRYLKEVEMQLTPDENGLVYVAKILVDAGVAGTASEARRLIDGSGVMTAAYDYGGDYLRRVSISGDGYAALLLGRYRTGTQHRVVTVNSEGQELASLELDAEVSSLSAAGRYVAVLCSDHLTIYDKQLLPVADLEEVSQAREVLMRSDGSAVLAGSTAASLYLP